MEFTVLVQAMFSLKKHELCFRLYKALCTLNFLVCHDMRRSIYNFVYNEKRVHFRC